MTTRVDLLPVVRLVDENVENLLRFVFRRQQSQIVVSSAFHKINKKSTGTGTHYWHTNKLAT